MYDGYNFLFETAIVLHGEAMTTLAPLNKNDWDLECEELAKLWNLSPR
jgi:hypothetical protein